MEIRLNGWQLGLIAVALVALGAFGTTTAKERGLLRLNLEGRSDSRPFSHLVVAEETVYVAGTLGLVPGTRKPPEDPKAEARLALDGIKAKLALADLTMDDLVSVQVFCPDLELYDAFNEVYGTYFSKGKYPVRTFVGSGPLLFGTRFEINGIAYKGD